MEEYGIISKDIILPDGISRMSGGHGILCRQAMSSEKKDRVKMRRTCTEAFLAKRN
ncbi:hypothetical protein V1224_13670 [Lachnospiraceae bacterium JLR.KK008]